VSFPTKALPAPDMTFWREAIQKSCPAFNFQSLSDRGDWVLLTQLGAETMGVIRVAIINNYVLLVMPSESAASAALGVVADFTTGFFKAASAGNPTAARVGTKHIRIAVLDAR
jgi:hypothetical protein